MDMKKEYIKPVAEELLLDTVQMIATSMLIGDGEATEEGGALSNGRRGTWGNLWYKGE